VRAAAREYGQSPVRISTYVYKRAFNWNTFDLGYPSAIAVVWFFVVVGFVVFFNLLFRRRERLEY